LWALKSSWTEVQFFVRVNDKSGILPQMSALGQKQTLTLRSDDARFTSKADIEATQTDVR
jgi:glycine cleavage system regulatory protein